MAKTEKNGLENLSNELSKLKNNVKAFKEKYSDFYAELEENNLKSLFIKNYDVLNDLLEASNYNFTKLQDFIVRYANKTYTESTIKKTFNQAKLELKKTDTDRIIELNNGLLERFKNELSQDNLTDLATYYNDLSSALSEKAQRKDIQSK